MARSAGLVVVGVDGSPDSLEAVRWAGRYAVAFGHPVELVAAWQWPLSYGYPMTFDGFDPEADAQAVLEKAAAELASLDLEVTATGVQAPAGHTLVKLSEGASILVVGSHGHGAVSGVLLGSVSMYCVHHAPCPVAVIR